MFRNVDSTTGRFPTQDPIGYYYAELNPYRNVANNPTNFVDPTGLGAKLTEEQCQVICAGLSIPSDGALYWPCIDLCETCVTAEEFNKLWIAIRASRDKCNHAHSVLDCMGCPGSGVYYEGNCKSCCTNIMPGLSDEELEKCKDACEESRQHHEIWQPITKPGNPYLTPYPPAPVSSRPIIKPPARTLPPKKSPVKKPPVKKSHSNPKCPRPGAVYTPGLPTPGALVPGTGPGTGKSPTYN
jgi:hypothetical protein